MTSDIVKFRRRMQVARMIVMLVAIGITCMIVFNASSVPARSKHISDMDAFIIERERLISGERTVVFWSASGPDGYESNSGGTGGRCFTFKATTAGRYEVKVCKLPSGHDEIARFRVDIARPVEIGFLMRGEQQ